MHNDSVLRTIVDLPCCPPNRHNSVLAQHELGAHLLLWVDLHSLVASLCSLHPLLQHAVVTSYFVRYSVMQGAVTSSITAIA